MADPAAAQVKRIDATDPVQRALLQWIQLATLPGDEPINCDEGAWWVAYVGGAPVGFGGVKPSSQFANCGYLCRSGVIPSHRGRGLQKRLIRAREQYAKRQGWEWLLTDTCDNPASANSLASMGYRMYQPRRPWALPRSLYWRKKL